MLILGLIKQSFISFGIWIVSGIYHIVNFAFEIFFALARGKLVDSGQYQDIINSFYVIIGIVMLFVLAFSLLKAMVNPEDQSKGTSAIKKIIINIISSAVIMAVVPIVFNFAFDVQAAIFEQNTLGGIFGSNSEFDTESNAEGTVKVQSRKLVNSVFTAFLYPNEDWCANNATSGQDCEEQIEPKDDDKVKNLSVEKNYKGVSSYVANNGGFGIYTDFAGNVDDGELEFNFIISLLAGLILLYVAVSFCFDMALRLVKLVFYQIIAPIPIFLRIVPTGKLNGIFNKWLTICCTVYLESFIRIIVVYFVIWIYKTVDLGAMFSEFDGFSGLIAQAFLILGLVLFMRQAPKIFSEVTGLDSGNMKLGIKDKLKDSGLFTAGAVIGASATGLARKSVEAVNNSRNKWDDIKGKTGTDKAKAIGSFAGSIFSGVGRVAAGTASSSARALRAGANAGSASDMRNAASKGAKDAIAAGQDRKAYKAKHGGHTLPRYDKQSGKWTDGALLGHVKDTGYRVERWAGVNNTDELIAKNKVIDDVTAAIKNIDATSRDIILGDVQKGKNVNYGITATDATGQIYNTKKLRELQQKMESLRGQAGYANAQDEYDKYLKEFADAVSNEALKGEKTWNTTVSRENQAALGKLRIVTNKARETLSQNVNASFTRGLEAIGASATVNRPNDRVVDVLDPNKDLDVNHIMLKNIKDEMTIEKTNNQLEIDRINTRNEETNSNGH